MTTDYDSLPFRRYTYKAELDKAIHTLEGILKGIAIDNIINQKEVDELKIWQNYYKCFENKHPFSELMPVVTIALADNILNNEELKDLLWLCSNLKTDNIYYDIITSDIQRLQGILHGILLDDIIAKDEIVGLQDWLEDNNHLTGIYPYDEINGVVTAVLKDGILSEDEKILLKLFFNDFIGYKISSKKDNKELSNIKKQMKISGICTVCPKIMIQERVFCFTGSSSRTTRNNIKNIIESLDGVFKNTVSKQIDYLVVGDNGSPCWAFSCYGRKVEMAVNLRKSGHRILIVHENDFWDCLEDYVDK